MAFLIIALLLLLITGWILFSWIEMDIDTRVPQAAFKWSGIGNAILIHEKNDWLLKVKVFFYRKEWPLSKLLFDRPKKKSSPKKVRRKGGSSKLSIQRFLNILSTFRVKEWQLAIDANDNHSYIILYPFNFLPHLSKHLNINFQDETYLFLRIRNQPWRILYALIK